jgi:hypothetical protein
MKKIISFFVFILAMSSCTHYYYIPPTHNVPLFREKGEYRAAVSMGGGEEISTIDIQTACSITDKFAVLANFMTADGGNRNSENWGKGNYLDAAFGYFQPIGAHGVFEIYGGCGGSKQHHQYRNGETSDLSFTKIFIQPSTGLTFSGMDVALSCGLSNIYFFNIVNNYENNFPVDDIAKNKNNFLFEPSLTVRGGWKYLKLQFQLGFSQNLSNKNLNFETTKLNAGLTFAFGKRFQKKNSGIQINPD